LAISYKLFIATGLGQLTNSISNLISELHIFCSIHRQLVPLEYLSQNLQNLTDKITKWIIKSSTIKSCKKPSTRIAPVNLFKQPASFKFLLYRKTGVNINMQPEIKEHKIYLRTKDLYSFLTPATQNPKKRKSTGSISSTTVLA
jgi:hypothetical protein